MGKISRRQLIQLAAVTTASAGFGGRVWAADNQINLSYQTGDINVLLMYVAKSKLFEKHGLNVNLMPFAAGPQQLPTLASGDADMAWLGEPPMISSYVNGLPIQLFLIERTDTSHYRIVANQASGIRSLAGLKGKRLGVTIGSTSHFLALLALSQAKLKPSDVVFVNLSPASMPPAYFAGQIDAACTWEPNVSIIEKGGGKTIATAATLGKRYTAGVMVARKQFLDSSPQKVQRFLGAWQEGLLAYQADPKKVMVFEAQRLGISVEEMAALVARQNSHRPTLQAELSPEYLGHVGANVATSQYVAHLQEIADFLVQLKAIPNAPIDWAGLINPKPVADFVAGYKG
jgi:taurine transport system substrate-binding protein